MIISRLFGGAGNQLFQYAAGRALADHLGTDLALDTRYVAGNDARGGSCFAHFAQARFTDAPLPPSKMDSALRYGLWRAFGRSPRFHREKGLGFDPAFFDLPDQTYLHGYWQSERYFGDLGQLRADLTQTTPLTPGNAATAVQIAAAPNPVSIHVRRGDYLSSGAYAACTADYYRAGLDHIRTQTGQPPTLFVFSNDPAWARDNLDLGTEKIVVDLNDESTGHFDMHLMSLCAHHIIANSTFSWWGAWLNPSPDKIIVAPKQWFGAQGLENPDLIPDRWTRL